ncbi:MAG: hypothetical protein AMXMBFR13_06270 [Phycisphaerae bacterium]
MGYVHVEISTSQSPRRPGGLCGDVVTFERTTRGTTVICCDGIGHGIKANIAATMTVSRLEELLRRSYSLREAVAGVAGTLTQAKEKELPYACFSLARINTEGEATVLSYESPPAILISGRRFASVLPRRPLLLDAAWVHESSCYVEGGEGLVLVSDGITQAGLGTQLRDGWGIEGVCRCISHGLATGTALERLPTALHMEAQRIDNAPANGTRGDDCTVVLAHCRPGRMVNVLTGPPGGKESDAAVVRRFMALEGRKIVCGGTTAKIVGQQTHQRVAVRQEVNSLIAPPDYVLRGVDLATEGAVTLNQAFNIFDEDPTRYEKCTGVSRLCEMLREADRVAFMVGRTQNVGHDDISFRQRGILQRETIVPLLAEKLQRAGKLVTVEWV